MVGEPVPADRNDDGDDHDNRDDDPAEPARDSQPPSGRGIHICHPDDVGHACSIGPGAAQRSHAADSVWTVPGFELLPAVDVADGQAVRLVQGQAGSETSYGAPLDAALQW